MTPPDEWARCKPWIEAALPYAGHTHTIEDVKDAIDSGRAILMAGERSAMVFEVLTYPRLKALHGWLCGGDLDEIKGSNAQLDDLARRLGCSRITIVGRKGWERALKALGYETMCSTVVKEI